MPPGPRALGTATLLCATVLAGRSLAYSVVRRLRARGSVEHPTLVLGAGRVGAQLASLLLEHPEHGLLPVGFLDDDPLLRPEERPVPLLGDNSALSRAIVEFGARDVVVAFGSLQRGGHGGRHPHLRPARRRDLLRAEAVRAAPHQPRHGPGLGRPARTAAPRRLPVSRRGSSSAPWTSPCPAPRCSCCSPLLSVLALLVRLEGGPGVLFRQQRVGLDGRPFDMIKLPLACARSTRPSRRRAGTWPTTTASARWAASCGRTSLDELPQLWNVLRGDMTLVGPRPERPLLRLDRSRRRSRATPPATGCPPA